VTIAQLARQWPELAGIPASVARQVENDGRYQGYLPRQDREIAAFRRDQELRVPEDLDYRRIGGLSTEVCSKLSRARPATLAAASRIPGITPAALTALLGHVKRARREGGESRSSDRIGDADCFT